MPSMLEEMTSSNNIDFMERSMANSSVPGKERGAMVHGAPFTGLTYALAFSTGEGQNNAEDDIRVDDVDTLARVTANLAEMADIKNMVIHTGVNYSNTDLDQASDIGYDGRTEARGVRYFFARYFAGIAHENTIGHDRCGRQGE